MRKKRDKDGTRWSCGELNYLAKHMDSDVEEVAIRMGRSTNAIMSMKYKLKNGFEVPEDDYVPMGLTMTQDEKVSRIYKMAADMRVRLKQ